MWRTQKPILGRSLAELFDVPPTRWGLRGDPPLWQALAQGALHEDWPASPADLTATLERLFENVTAYPLNHAEPVYVAACDQGGLSAGLVSPAFWRETVLPLLQERYARAPHVEL
ncbi:MAG: hypothetical protein ACO1RX_08905 [Candidatus Sericytochromatia bacterium]